MRMQDNHGRDAPTRLPARRTALVRGFTLVELAVVMAIVGILAAVAVPATKDFIAKRAVDAHAQELVASLRLARSEAMKRGIEVSVCASDSAEAASTTCSGGSDWGPGWLVYTDVDALGTLDDSDKALRVQAGVHGIKSVTTAAKSVTLARNGILLLQDGEALGADATISFVIKPLSGDDDGARTVCLNKQGRVSVSRGIIVCA